jgi:predicted outer membrane repeat protein
MNPLLLHLALIAHATDYEVGPGHAYATVGTAIAAATADPGDGHTIRIFGAGPYVEGVTVTESMTVRVEEGAVLSSGIAADGFFRVDTAGVVLTLEDVTIDGGATKRALHQVSGGLDLQGVTRQNTAFAGDGGCLLIDANAANTVEIHDSTLTSCNALGGGADGGAIAVLGGTLVVDRSSFLGNTTADHGGHLHFDGDSLTITDSLFAGGVGGKRGGALDVRGGDVLVQRSAFESNQAASDRGGGAIYSEGPSSLTIEDSRFASNAADGTEGGGAIYQRDNIATLVRDVFCNNTAVVDGGGYRLHGGSATLENVVFLGDSAGDDGGAVWVAGGMISLEHASISATVAGDFAHGAGTAVGPTALLVSNSYFADHPALAFAFDSLVAAGATSLYDAFWNNAGGDFGAFVIDLGGTVVADSLIPPPTAGGCDATELVPPLGSPLIGADSDGGTIGAFGGPNTWTDNDGDGVLSLDDCDDDDPAAYPGAPEIFADGIDQDCDTSESCWEDSDLDGFGTPGSVTVGKDLDCLDSGEAANDQDVCEGFDDAIDPDGDSVPDGCDLCPLDNPDDTDGDGVCDTDDQCPGADDGIDSDLDTVADGCDPCPFDAIDDTDGDGVCESLDQCPGFDDALDADADGQPDDCDACPADPLDDSDGDGVCDGLDPCPADNPDDSDLDGVCETDDACPGQDDRLDMDSDGEPDACDGCPIDPLDDSDGDGSCDSDDLCADGDDALDTDADGVPDFCDQCPGFDDHLDADADGVPDGCDPGLGDTGGGGEDTDDGDTDSPPVATDRAPEDTAATTSKPGGCGCESGSRGAAGWSAPVWLALLAVRRRRAGC